jgi:predicted RNA-binding protein associated with RNAse of E/G family
LVVVVDDAVVDDAAVVVVDVDELTLAARSGPTTTATWAVPMELIGAALE